VKFVCDCDWESVGESIGCMSLYVCVCLHEWLVSQ
jgi:hypothetical protein